jgi:hypothetical protein
VRVEIVDHEGGSTLSRFAPFWHSLQA